MNTLTRVSRHLKWREIACRRDQTLWVPITEEEQEFFFETIEAFEATRARFGHPLLVTSGYRSRGHNRAIGGAENSFHLKLALDLKPRWQDFPTSIEYGEALQTLGALAADEFDGVGRYASFIHGDCRSVLGFPQTAWSDATDWSPV